LYQQQQQQPKFTHSTTEANNAMAFVAVVAIVVVSFNELVLVATGARDTPLLQPPATPPAEAAQFQDPGTPAPWPPSHLRLGFVGAYFYYLTLSFAALQLIFACSLCTCVGEGKGGWETGSGTDYTRKRYPK